MSCVLRVFVEKKAPFAVEAKTVFGDIKENLQVPSLLGVRIFNRYDVEGIDQDIFEASLATIFSEPQVDSITESLPSLNEPCKVFAVEYLPGQYDQRADSCEQCIQILTQKDRPRVRTAKVFMLLGSLSDEELACIKDYLINPVESREASLDKPNTLQMHYDIPKSVPTVDDFIAMEKEELFTLRSELGLAMDNDDILFCQNYFKNTEKRNPTITEIRMLDTYWSDHCRHTTFLTEIDEVSIADDYIKKTYQEYLDCRRELYQGKHKNLCLMDIATIGMKWLRNSGKLSSLDQSEEINACSVHITIEVDNKPQKWLLMFKNETHNHPTEIEPFGGAATCLGGAIRDPLSGRSYVYQAMRVTGAADPTLPMNKTLEGKLPQRKIVTTAAEGYSSYGNQIGLATGLVNEIYHPGYVAKRMEIGAVIGAAPLSHVVRKEPTPGDVIILIGGRTGRDGCGGATGSSKSHTLESLTECGAEVQKGNPPEERKLQRLFRNDKATTLIKRCNDFGAGGVSVAIGELADGLSINLNAILKKYDGLDGTELAISESQERMAVVVDPKDADTFISLATDENLEAVKVALVTDDARLTMHWNDSVIADISRDFLNSNGAPKHTHIAVAPVDSKDLLHPVCYSGQTYEEKFHSLVKNLNVCSQKGLYERFDSTIGAGTVVMPGGGKYQISPSQYMAALIPVLEGSTEDTSLMAYGFNPYISSKSPYHGAVFAVTESIAKIIAAGGSLDQCWLTLQEYFERTNNDATRWGKPFAALLGAFAAQKGFSIAAIGGKDSMSGTFMDIDVPPTLVSFAVSMGKATGIVSNHFKKAGSRVVLVPMTYDENNIPVFAEAISKYRCISKLIGEGKILSSFALSFGGVAEAICKLCFGNRLGFVFDPSFDLSSLFDCHYGSILLEVTDDANEEFFIPVGNVQENSKIVVSSETIDLLALQKEWEGRLEKVFPTQVATESPLLPISYKERNLNRPKFTTPRPKVLIPVFPGTNCEYDTAKKFTEAGADCEIFVFKNFSASLIEESIAHFTKLINQSQIFMLPGGFSGGDEPDGSGKFISVILRNPAISEAVMNLLYNRDGLALGICNGFQALIKLGLVPYGKITNMTKECPTLTFNTIGRHQSSYVYTKITSVKSPWFSRVKLNDIHAIPISHGEGRFVANPEVIQMLIQNGQIATQYVDFGGNPSMDIAFNPNGSMMAIEGITSPDGRILGKMGHTERSGKNLAQNIYGEKDQQIFAAGIDYFK
jgi:phosphoribosylformylglycinamidine synthase